MMSGPFFIVSCPITGAVIGIICVIIVTKCRRLFLKQHYLRQYRLEMQQIVY